MSKVLSEEHVNRIKIMFRKTLFEQARLVANGADPQGVIRNPEKNRRITLPGARRSYGLHSEGFPGMMAEDDPLCAGMKLDSRIDRMDKLTQDRGHVLIDYKTGGLMSTRQWEGPRPDDPQVPLYAIAASEELSAVAFAKLRAGEMKFVGFSRTAAVLPDVAPPKSQWQALLAQWKKDAEALGKAFAAGDAHVDPKEELKTCRRCELHTLCRVYEKFSGLARE